jgi:hypothetical protein
MASESGPNPSEEQETEQQRLNRELDQLLQELRVAMPGVQVLFAFLLAVPFQQRFPEVTEFQEYTYFSTLLASASASAFFIAPTAYHRIMFQRRDKPHLIRVASRMALAGLFALGLAMIGAVLLVTDLLFRDATVIVTASAMATLYLSLWFGLPLMRRLRGERSH